MLIVGDHHIVIFSLTIALAFVLLGAVGSEMHGRCVVPKKEWLVGFVRLVDEPQRLFRDFVVDGFHALFRQRPGILDFLAALAVGPAVEHTSRPELLLELRVLWIIGVFGLLFRIQVIEIAEELVEAMHRRQELILVAEMVFSELTRGVTERLEKFGDRGIFRAETNISPGHTDLGQPSANGVLAGYERGASRSAALLTVIVGEGNPLIGDSIDIGRAVSHLSAAVVTDVPPSDIVAPEYKNVWFFGFSHFRLLPLKLRYGL